MRRNHIKGKLEKVIEEVSGVNIAQHDSNASFIELGLDSLVLTQLALLLKKEFNTNITFRQLSESLSDIESLMTHLDSELPQEAFPSETATVPDPVPQAAPTDNKTPSPVSQAIPSSIQEYLQAPNYGGTPDSGGTHQNVVSKQLVDLISKQIEILSHQIRLLNGDGQSSARPAFSPSIPAAPQPTRSETKNSVATGVDKDPKVQNDTKPKTFGAMAKIEKVSTELTPLQKTFLEGFTKRFNEKTKGSKEYTQRHRSYMADPRVVSGFKPVSKEITYSLVVNKSKGNRLWDIDGNEYLDALNGFGSILFGHRPDFIQKAILDQMEQGYEVGPQHELSGAVSKLICEITGHERAALCNTGSEAVMGALRMARTVTGRSLVVAFNGSYHGIFDEVIVRGLPNGKSFPAAAGIMPEAVKNILVLDYGTPESLKIIKERKDELAAILVEPIQSRRPEFRPVDFLKELREITTESGSALIFDEVITGFRMHPQGAQGLFGIKADIATYGKVIGGGLPIGAIAGSSEFMDALDGGYWEFGNDSVPEAGVTYFAGTFVRHPLALASAKASLEYIKQDNGNLQRELAEKANKLASALDNVFNERGLPFSIAHFGSLWRMKYEKELPYTDLIFSLLREKGIHVYDGFPSFLTASYTDDDINRIIHGFREAIDEMLLAGFFSDHVPKVNGDQHSAGKVLYRDKPPVPGARLGKDQQGNPAWFVRDEKNPNEFLKIKMEH